MESNLLGQKIRVVLIEDHTIVRQGIAALLSTAPDVVVVGEAGDGRAGLDAVERLKPDVVLCDLALPGLGGLEVMRQLGEHPDPPACLVLSMYHDSVWVQRAIDAGAKGYVLKGSAVKDLVLAIRIVASGGQYLSPGAKRAAESEELSPREREVLTAARRGAYQQRDRQHSGHQPANGGTPSGACDGEAANP